MNLHRTLLAQHDTIRLIAIDDTDAKLLRLITIYPENHRTTRALAVGLHRTKEGIARRLKVLQDKGYLTNYLRPGFGKTLFWRLTFNPSGTD